MEIERGEAIIDDVDYCDNCGDQIDINLTTDYFLGMLLCKKCWREERDKEIGD